MSSKDQPTQSDIGPEDATKFRPYTEDETVDAEGHVIKATEDAGIEPEGAVKARPYTEDDDATGIEPDGGARRCC